MKFTGILSASLIAAALCLGAAAERAENAELGIAFEVPDGAEHFTFEESDTNAVLYTVDDDHAYKIEALDDTTYEKLVEDAKATRQMLNGLPADIDISFNYEETTFGDFEGLYTAAIITEQGTSIAEYDFAFEYGGKLIFASYSCYEKDEDTAKAFFTSLSILPEGAETPSSVEISFKVGESTLLINGKEVTVETPYTVGDGVTLVPVRVITEAFGAKVGWNEETETVTIDYPDVSVALQIGSAAAEVNGRFTPLPAAPELSEAGYTMVPLRFLSETFGAEVSYDEETEAILVTLGKAREGDIFTLDRGVKEKYIGSVKNGWAFETIGGLTFFDDSYAMMREEDGIALTDNSGTLYVVGCDKREDDFDFEEEYEELVDSLKETARFMKLEKNTTDYDYDFFEVQMLEKGTNEVLTLTRLYAFEDHIFLVLSIINLKNESAKDTAFAVLDSLTFDVDPDNTYDVGAPVTEMKEYTFDELGISFSAPESYDPAVKGKSYSDMRSNRVFGSTNGNGYIAVTFYSASDVEDVGKLLENQRSAELYGANKELFESTSVTKTEFCGYDAYAYELKRLTLGGVTLVGRQYAVTVGKYTYFIVATAKDMGTVDEIMNSFEITELDADKEGFIFCTEDRRDDLGSTFDAECGDYTISVPGVFECDEDATESNTTYYHLFRLNGTNVNDMVKFTFRQLDRGYYGMPLFVSMTAREAALTVFESNFDEETDEIVSPLSPVELGGRMWYAVTLTYEGSDDINYYETYYYCLDDGTFLELDYSWNELYNTPETKALGDSIVSSVKKTK